MPDRLAVHIFSRPSDEAAVMDSEATHILRVLRRHAYLMSGDKSAGDRVVASALKAGAVQEVMNLRLVGALREVYIQMPRGLPARMYGDITLLCSLPFFNRAAIILILIQKMALPEAAYVLSVPEECVGDLVLSGRTLLACPEFATADIRPLR